MAGRAQGISPGGLAKIANRASVIAASLLTPRGRQFGEPGARRLACTRHCPAITAGEIGWGIKIAAETARAEAAGQQVGAGRSDAAPIRAQSDRDG